MWDREDLIRRLLRVLDAAGEAIETIASRADDAWSGKVVAETAMLLLAATPIGGVEPRVRVRVDAVAAALAPLARSERVLAAICLEPGLARDHGVAHAILSRLGHPDAAVDALIAACAAIADDFGPERLPHRRLEHEWLARVWPNASSHHRPEPRLIRRSMLGRPLDVLGAARVDFYAHTHAVMYASDLGARRFALPRPARAIVADTDAALAYSLDEDDFDLTTELLLTFPMLRCRWTPAAVFAFRLLAAIEGELGFVPGSGFDPARADALPDRERRAEILRTSYHTIYVTGFLCAAGLSSGCEPSAAKRLRPRHSRTIESLLALLGETAPPKRWQAAFAAMNTVERDALAPLILAIVLRRSASRGDLSVVRDALRVALDGGIADGPAPSQAASLLRRAQTLAARVS